MAVDPLTGDLFVTNGGSGTLSRPDLWRIHDPAGPHPSVSVYGTDPTGFYEVAVAPNGTVYAMNRNSQLVSFGGTNTAQPAHETVVVSVPSTANNGLALGAIGKHGVPSFVYTSLTNLDRVDLPSGRVTKLLVSPIGSATIVIKIGPDGCLYVQDNRSTLRVSNAKGSAILRRSRLDVAAYVPTPAQISWSLRSVAQSWFWVAVLIVLLGAASTLFNSTLDANYTEIVGWFAPLRRRFSRKADAESRRVGRRRGEGGGPHDLPRSRRSGVHTSISLVRHLCRFCRRYRCRLTHRDGGHAQRVSSASTRSVNP